MRRRRRQIDTPPQQNSNLLLNLSLFIMLLAFFIILNGMSSFDEVRYKPIMESLALTFSSSPMQGDSAPSITPSDQKSIHEGETVERIDALFNAQLTGIDSDVSVKAGILQADVPLEEFDRAMRAVGQVDLTQVKSVTGLKTYFVPTLVSLISANEKGLGYRMDIIFHTKDNPSLLQNSDPAVLNDTIRRASEYARLLMDAGLKQQYVSIGIQKGREDRVTLFFHPYSVYSPNPVELRVTP